MAAKESSVTPVFSLKLLVDKKKNKVVLAESGKEFVDVLFSFLALPMGTIVRLLEKYQPQAATIGCFNMLYKSVFDLGIDNFSTEACKDMLLHPRTVMEKQLRRLKLNIDDTEAIKYYKCKSRCQLVYSNFSSTRCNGCGAMMQEEFTPYENVGGIFVSDKTLFIITDKMEVGVTSMGLTLKTLKDLGYKDTDQLREMLVDVDHHKVLALLKCLFTSDSPLTDVFLLERSSSIITKPILPLQEGNTCTGESVRPISVSVFTRKLDKKVIYVESGKDFVDLLFTFLALPLKFAWEISGSNILIGCVDSLCKSFKSLSSNSMAGKCMLPWNYRCQQPLLDICYANRESQVKISQGHYYDSIDLVNTSNGFMKSGKTFMIFDDLNITPMNLSSNISSLKKCNIGLDDIEEQVINISQTEAIRLLRATFMTSTALNTAFDALVLKKLKEEKR